MRCKDLQSVNPFLTLIGSLGVHSGAKIYGHKVYGIKFLCLNWKHVLNKIEKIKL